MRFAALVFGLIGGVLSGSLGAKWLSDCFERRAEVEEVRQVAGGALSNEFEQLDRRVRAAWCLIGASIVGLVGGFLAVGRMGKAAGFLFVAATVVPAVCAVETLLVTFFLGGAAVLAFAIRPVPAAPRFARPRPAQSTVRLFRTSNRERDLNPQLRDGYDSRMERRSR